MASIVFHFIVSSLLNKVSVVQPYIISLLALKKSGYHWHLMHLVVHLVTGGSLTLEMEVMVEDCRLKLFSHRLREILHQHYK